MQTRLKERWVGVAASIAATLAISGCGLGAGVGTKNASVLVSENFGSQVIGTAIQKHVPGSETVMSLTQHSFKVATRYGGGYVESIDGKAGSSDHRDWFYYVNGVLAAKGAAATTVHKGDHIWWDLHDWSATENIPDVVGMYPEPFINGVNGQLFPSVLDCASDVEKACNIVGAALRKAGVKVSYQGLGGGSGSDSLAVVVGTWNDVKGVIAAELIHAGPSESGVYGQFVGSNGQAIELDNPKGQVVETLHGSAGMVAATASQQTTLNAPTWMITGTDVAGVDAAARALTPAKLKYHFAVAVDGDNVIPIPLSPGQ